MGKKEELGTIIRTMRLSRNLTQAKLAKLIGQSPSSITMYENGKREPDFETLEALADVFNVPLSALVPSSESRPVVLSGEWNPEDMGWADREDNDIQIMARGMQKLTPENRALLLQVARKMFAKDFDEEGNKR